MIYLWLPLVFVLGAAVGSFINVCVYRLPYERSLFWPGSRCGRCYQRIRWYDNLPLVSYWLLRGRCRVCGAPFSIRYFLVELCTGLGFCGVFYLLIIQNVWRLQFGPYHFELHYGVVPLRGWAVFGHYAVLLSFLLVVSLCDLDDMEIPLSVTATGTIVGLLSATLFAWPFPLSDRLDIHPTPPTTRPPALSLMGHGPPPQPMGLYAWPVWYQDGQLPPGLPPGSSKLGLLTGLAGAAAGMLLVRGVRFVFTWGRGIEGLGLGDADLMMMAGAFIGWQPVVVGFFLAAFPALFFGLAQLVRKGDQRLPFGPALAIGVLLALFLWPSIGPNFWPFFSDRLMLALLGGVGSFILLIMAVMFRLLRGVPVDPAEAG
jgi:leader peptidase (prepilin peptidase)/N-methyltransferase